VLNKKECSEVLELPKDFNNISCKPTLSSASTNPSEIS
jgi:hypothetical protein